MKRRTFSLLRLHRAVLAALLLLCLTQSPLGIVFAEEAGGMAPGQRGITALPINGGATTIAMRTLCDNTTVRFGVQSGANDTAPLGNATPPTWTKGTNFGELTVSAPYSYLEFDIEVTKAGIYGVDLRAKTAGENSKVYLYIDGTKVEQPYLQDLYLQKASMFPYFLGSAELSEGVHTIRLCIHLANANMVSFDWLCLTKNSVASGSDTKLTATAHNLANPANAYGRYLNANKGYYYQYALFEQKGGYFEVPMMVPQNGTYDIYFYGMRLSASYEVPQLDITIDGGTAETKDYSDLPTFFNDKVLLSRSVYLAAGKHTMRITCGESLENGVKKGIGIARLRLELQEPIARTQLTYHLQGGSGAFPTQQATVGSPLCLYSHIPQRDGYRFRGWAETADGPVAYRPGDRVTADAPLALYAVWSASHTNTVTEYLFADLAVQSVADALSPQLTINHTIPSSFTTFQSKGAAVVYDIDLPYAGTYYVTLLARLSGKTTVYIDGQRIGNSLLGVEDTWYQYKVGSYVCNTPGTKRLRIENATGKAATAFLGSISLAHQNKLFFGAETLYEHASSPDGTEIILGSSLKYHNITFRPDSTQGAAIGQRLDMEVHIPTPGRFFLTGSFKMGTHGVYDIYVDDTLLIPGVKVGEILPDLPGEGNELELGSVLLNAGTHTISFVCTGTTNTNYNLAIYDLTFTCTNDLFVPEVFYSTAEENAARLFTVRNALFDGTTVSATLYAHGNTQGTPVVHVCCFDAQERLLTTLIPEHFTVPTHLLQRAFSVETPPETAYVEILVWDLQAGLQPLSKRSLIAQ